MGLFNLETPASASQTHLLEGARNASARSDWSVYRCQGCGQVIPYDSLAAQCQCTEECYSDNSAGADSVGLHT